MSISELLNIPFFHDEQSKAINSLFSSLYAKLQLYTTSDKKQINVFPKIIKQFLYNATLKPRSMHDFLVHNFTAASQGRNRVNCTTHALFRSDRFKNLDVQHRWPWGHRKETGKRSGLLMNDISLIRKRYMQLFVSHTVARQSHNVRNAHETQAKNNSWIHFWISRKEECLRSPLWVTVQVLMN